MALTDDELKALDTATLERLVAQLMTAIRSRNIAKLDRALDAMVDFSARTPFPELQVQAAKAQSAASKTIAEEALAELSAIADQMGSAEAGFKAAAKVAESGKKELLFPTLAGRRDARAGAGQGVPKGRRRSKREGRQRRRARRGPAGSKRS